MSISEVRCSHEVGFRRSHLEYTDVAPADPPWAPTTHYILTPPPFIEMSPSEGCTTE